MPNLSLASRVATRWAKEPEPTRLERIRSSVSIWQIVIAAVTAVVALALAGVVTHRLKGRTNGESGEVDSTSTEADSTSTEADSTSTQADSTSTQADSTSTQADSTSTQADSTSTNSGNAGNDTAPGTESTLTDTVQEEMHNSAGSS